VFQLGRIKGNFLFAASSTSNQMNDKKSLPSLLDEHARLFGKGTLNSFTADKGYWSRSNLRLLHERAVAEIGLQHPVNIKNVQGLPGEQVQARLRDRRAGIEPLIGHAKHGGQLGRSRMKSDTATLAAGYASVLGFNLRQIVRKQRPSQLRAA
jgi:hypothetical protein